jgi:phosphatidate cytidylyltransferase
MAPSISPKKSWEGSVAGFATAVLAAAVWSVWRLGSLDGALVGVAACTAVAAQLGDLVESMIKRGAGVKDSGHLLPGHGGMFDRLDAMLFAAPVLLLGLWLVGFEMH